MKVLVFGEILYDVYNGNAIIGGAPFNYSLQLSRIARLAKSVSVISSVGKDDFGNEAIAFAQKELIDTSLIQRHDKFETGKATVFLDEKTKVPDYIIHENVAWDNIEYTDDINTAIEKNSYDMIYCNILCLRNECSYNTFKKIMGKINPKIRVFDITIRKDYYTKDKIEKVLSYINVLKINDDELECIKNLFYPDINIENSKLLMEKIRTDFDIPYIFLTLGKKGACLLSDNGFFEEPSNDVKVVDTVGAGDSFTAALSYALYKGIDEQKTLKFALAVAEEMIQVSGGTGTYDVDAVIENVLDVQA